MTGRIPGDNIPLIGKQIARIGRISRIMAQPCDPDPIIAVEAFFYNIPQIFGTIFKPQYLNDPEEHFGINIGMRKGRHGRRRFQAEELFPGVGPGARKFGWWIFRISAMAQKVGWYFLIVDAGAQFAVNWTSLAYTWGGCTDPTSGNTKSTLDINGGAPGWAGKYVDLWSNYYATPPCWGNTTYVGSYNDEIATFFGNVQLAEPLFPTPRAETVVVRFVNVLSGVRSDPHPLKYTDPPGTAATFVHRDFGFRANRNQWACEVVAADGYFGLKGQMRLSQSHLDGVLQDP